MIWDNASWHIGREVQSLDRKAQPSAREKRWWGEARRLSGAHEGSVAQSHRARVVHGKRKVVEPNGMLAAYELAERVCAAFGCARWGHPSVTKNVARSYTRHLLEAIPLA